MGSTSPSDIEKAVAQAIYDELEGPIANQDHRRQKRQWELSVKLARVAMTKIEELS